MIGPLNLHLQMAHECKKGTAVKHRQGGFSVWAEGVRRHLIQVYVSCLHCQGLQEVKMSIVFQIITGAVKPCPLGRGYKAYRAAMSFNT